MLYNVLAWTSGGKLLADGGVTVDLSAEFNRERHPDREVEDGIERMWEERVRLKGSGTIWNATKFRFHSIGVRGDGSGGKTDVSWHLRLGITDYREYQGTNLRVERPLSVFGNERYLSQAFGNACIVTTTDDRVVFLVRSSSVGEGEGAVVLPGGHAEPSRLGITEIASQTGEVTADAVVRELFGSIFEEVVEELRVEPHELDRENLKLLGVVQRRKDLKAQLVGSMGCFLSSSQLCNRWTSGGECASLLLLSRDELPKVAKDGQVRSRPLMPEHHGSVAMFVKDGVM